MSVVKARKGLETMIEFESDADGEFGDEVVLLAKLVSRELE